MATLEDNIKRFLSIGSGSGDGYGYGYGDGDGSGYGYGYGYGDGDGSGHGYGYGYGYGDGDGSGHGSGYGSGDGSGYGYGYGDGDGSGEGYGSGDGDGVQMYAEKKVYMVDNVATLIDAVHRDYAKGNILQSDLTLKPCYIAKVGNFFAHGETLKDARRDAQQKYDDNLPIKERIANFIKKYPTLDTVAKGTDLFYWHHTLTGSCTMGREQFCQEHGLNPKTTKMTITEFIRLTENAYGGSVIKQLHRAYK